VGQEAGGTLHLPSVLVSSTAFYSITAALQIVTTSMIVFKLLGHRWELRKQGFSHNTAYVSLAGILAESAGIYAIATVAYIPMFRSDNPVQIWWGQLVASLVVGQGRKVYVPCS
jgi:hypothetical protein